MSGDSAKVGKRAKFGEWAEMCVVREIRLLVANTYELCMNCDMHGHWTRSQLII